MKSANGHRLQIEEGMAFQRREWRAERIGWAAMFLLLLGALLGLFGYGPLSKVRAHDNAGMTVEYDRLQRSSAPTEWRFDVDGEQVRGGALRMEFERRLIQDIEIDSIMPEPAQVRATSQGTEFVFNVVEGSDANVVFRFRPATFGRRTGEVSTPGATPVVIDQFIYP